MVNKSRFYSPISTADKLIIRTLNELRHNKDIEIKPADKNLGTVIMDRELYERLCFDILTDHTTYEVIDNTHTYISDGYKLLREILKHHDLLHVTTYDRQSNRYRPIKRLTKMATCLLQLEKSAKPGRFYILPKMHKSKLAGRPIVASNGTLTYHTSVFLHNALYPTVKYRLPSVCLSNKEIILDLLRIQNLPEEAVILCADVKSLYPSIPIRYGLKKTKEILERFPNHYQIEDIELFLDLLEWVLTNNFLNFKDQIYHQIQGTAMGTPVAPTYANIVLAALEQPCLDLIPIYYKRFIDDLFIICRNIQQAEQIVRTFNAQCPSIQLEAVTIGKTGIFLDMELTITTENNIHMNLYQKRINKYLYIPPTSNHPPHIMKNVIREELKRYRLLCEDDTDYTLMKERFRVRLLNRGYSETYLDDVYRDATDSRASLLKNLGKRPLDKRLKKHKTSTTLQPIQEEQQGNLTIIYEPISRLYNLPPVVVTKLPHLINFNRVKQIFKTPLELKQLPLYQRTFGNRDIIIGRKLNKTAGRYFLHRPPAIAK
jgi:hypothetical protein